MPNDHQFGDVFLGQLFPEQLYANYLNTEDLLGKFLVGMVYHEPEALALWHRGIVEDYESSTGLFIEAATGQRALAWGEQVGQELLRDVNADPSLNWKELGYYCWLEDNPAASRWQHCLDFFQTVSEGEFPDFGEMGTQAYIRWENSQNSSALAEGK